MAKYEYMVGGLGSGWPAESEQSQLNELGQQGWRLLAVITKPVEREPCTFYYMMREIHDLRLAAPNDQAEPRRADPDVASGKDKQ